MGTLTNSEEPDCMVHKVAFPQGVGCLLTIFRDRYTVKTV